MADQGPSGILKDRIALITGASRGIGAAMAKRVAAEGAHVILVARTQGGLEEVDDAIRAAGGQATLTPLDLADMDKIDQLERLVHIEGALADDLEQLQLHSVDL